MSDGLERAKNASIPTEYHNLVPYKKRYPENVDRARSEYDKDLATKVLDDNPSLLVCAGWMHVLSPSFLDPVAQAQVQVINLHPALPGQYDGTEAVSRAHNAWLQGRITQTGVMIHKVIAEVDQGTPIIVEEIPFVKGEDEDVERFEQKLHSVEWRLIVQATAIVLSEIEKRKSDKTTGGCD